MRINFVGDRLQDTEVKLENEVPPETAGVDVYVLNQHLVFE